MAWFDEPGARDQVDARAATPADREILRSWVDDGYAVVEGVVPHDLLDEMVADLDEMFTGDDPFPGLVLHDLVMPDGHRPQTDHRDLCVFDRVEREAIRDRSNWRVHGFYHHSRAADAVREHPELRRIASLILGHESRATYSINFHNGSTQKLHQDSAVFHLGVPNLICGAWIACEDIVEGSGPLVYHPGSHRRPMFPGFDAYPTTNLRTADPTTSAAYNAHVAAEADEFEEHEFLARKGDVLFWHGMLIHGGQAIRRPGTTRRSYVVHFVPDGADVADQVTGPTNW
ncbi:MAG: phytanoyl-CoA dioxygenase [Ilumatobacter sp.]|nr:phytanoyl-CoA dioxygenase [Ilumatobacter sp.]